MAVEIRLLPPWEISSAEPLLRDAWISGHGHLFPDSAQKLRRGEGPDVSFSYQVPSTGNVYVAVLNGQMVGGINLRPLDDGYGLIEPIAVEPAQHRRGIGTALWKHCENVAKSHGFKGLQVWAVEGNQRAHDFYQALGCKPFATGSVNFDGVERTATGYKLDF